MDTVNIDWNYLLERIETLMDMGEEYLSRKLSDYQVDPEIFESLVAFRWVRENQSGFLGGVTHPDIPDRQDLIGIDKAIGRLYQNTLQFVNHLPANNVLLWGERGCGKSSSVKSLLREFAPEGLRLIEVQKEDLFQLPEITARLRGLDYRFILFCDDLSFDESEPGFREMKALLEGGIEARPENVLVYATSNRRHLIPERFEENNGRAEIHPEEAVSEKLSLSDRFGITLGFYPMSRPTYLEIIRHHATQRELPIEAANLEKLALQWSEERGGRSGRIARQFIDDLTGRLALEIAARMAEEDNKPDEKVGTKHE